MPQVCTIIVYTIRDWTLLWREHSNTWEMLSVQPSFVKDWKYEEIVSIALSVVYFNISKHSIFLYLKVEQF